MRHDAPLRARGLIVCLMLAASGWAQADPSRERFVEAESLIEQGRIELAQPIVESLRDYPLYPYLVHALLSASIEKVTPERIQSFLSTYPDLPTTAAMHEAWILERARRGAWRGLADDPDAARHARSPQARCRVAEAAWRAGRPALAWEQVEALWPSGSSLPDACDPVLAAWRDAGRMSPRQVWRRLLKAVPAGSGRLVRYLRGLLPAEDQLRLEQWLSLRAGAENMSSALSRLALDPETSGTVTLDVFDRLVKRSSQTAAQVLSSLDDAATFPPGLLDALAQRLGEHLARRNDPLAFRYLTRRGGPRALESRAQLSIARQDWPELRLSLGMMEAETASRDPWRYWAGRVQALLGEEVVDPAFRALARERGYYAFLAADRLGLPYNMAPRTLEAAPGDLDAVARIAAVSRVRELTALRRAPDALAEWFHLLDRLDSAGQRTAARLASDRSWHALAIFAAGRAGSWDDLTLRFPLAHRTHVTRSASETGLEEARIFAIIRQESAFMDGARSSAGALGPMQLMPATARRVARDLGLSRPAGADLQEAALNIALGSRYLAKLHQGFGDHRVLASAAYNAGPGNVRGWLPAREAVPSEVWIESIPFSETRDYVRRVLAYEAIYRFRLGQEQIRISNWMPPVSGG